MFNGQQVAYVTDDTAAAIFAVSLNSGGRTLISDNTSQSEPAFVYPWAVAYGSEGVLYVSDNAVPAIFKVDLESGVRSVIATSEEGSLISEPRGIFLLEDDISSRIYVADKGNIVSLATDGGNQVLVSGPDQPDASNPINVAFGVVMSEQGDLIAIDSGNEKKMLRVDPDSGARSTLNSDIFSALNAIAAHPGERSVLVVDDVSGELSLINIGTGERVVLSSSLIPEGINVVSDPWGVATSPDHGYALVVDPVLKTVMAVDLVSGKRTVLSKSN